MKKNLTTMFVALMCVGLGLTLNSKAVFAEDIAIDSAHFPDDEFRRYLSENIDSDGNGILSSDEINNTTKINIFEKDADGNKYEVKDTTGLQYFTEITTLDCYMCGLEKIDISSNTKLQSVNLAENNLTYIDVSNCTNILNISLEYNNLSSIDVSNNTSLISLDLRQNNIKEIDLTNNLQLGDLDISYNSFTELDLSRNFKLNTLNIEGNRISYLDLSVNVNVKFLNASNNGMLGIDLGKGPIQFLKLYGNNIRSVDLSSFTALKGIVEEAPFVGSKELWPSKHKTNFWEMDEYYSAELINLDTSTKIIINGVQVVLPERTGSR